MSDKTLQDRLLAAVEALKLKFPVAEIAEKTGYGQPIVSTYLNGKQPVSAKFLKSFCEAFGLDAEEVKTGKLEKRAGPNGKENPDSIDYQGKFLQAMDNQDGYIKALLRIVESSLSRVLEDQTGISALIGELLLRNIDQEAGGNPDKAQEILKGILRRIGPKLSSGVKEDIAADGRS